MMTLNDNEASTAAEKIPDVMMNTETEDSDTDLSVNSNQEEESLSHLTIPHLERQSASSRENTPDKKISRRLSSANWESEKQDYEQETSDDLSSESSLKGSHPESKKRKVVWIQEDGEIYLDRGNTCKFSYIRDYLEDRSAANLASELTDAIGRTCDPANKEKFKIELGHGGTSRPTDVELKKGTKPNKKVKKITKMSELSINLDEPSELTKLVESYKESLSKAIREILQLEAEFDKCTIYKMKGPSHNLPYGNAIGDENGNFSPVVAILPLGMPELRVERESR